MFRKKVFAVMATAMFIGSSMSMAPVVEDSSQEILSPLDCFAVADATVSAFQFAASEQLRISSYEQEYNVWITPFDNYNNINQGIINTFDTANASLFYQKEDSPWGFEINATNLFDVRFRQSNSFNAFVISDNQTFILPRIVMFVLSYKL